MVLSNTLNRATVLVILCLVTRLSFFFATKPWEPIVTQEIVLGWEPDAIEYHALATTMLDHHQFAFEKNAAPEALRTPGYPFFIVLIYGIFGKTPWIVLLFQTLVDTTSCVLVFLALAKSLSARAAFFGSLFYALDPNLIFNSVCFLSDTLFVFFCVAALFFFSRGVQKRFGSGTMKDIVCCALSFGFAALVRPIALYLPIVVVAVLFVVLSTDLKRASRYSVVFTSVFILILSPWVARNVISCGSASFSTSGAYNLLILNVAPMEMEQRGQTKHEVEIALLREADSLAASEGMLSREPNGFERSRYWQKVALQYIVQRPASFVKHFLLGILHSFVNVGTQGFAKLLHLPDSRDFQIKAYDNLLVAVQQWLQQKPMNQIVIGIIVGGFLLLSYVLLLIGLFVSRERYDRAFLFFCLIMTLYFILVTGAGGLVRFKLPAIPFYLAFVGIGAEFATTRRDKRLRNPDGSDPEALSSQHASLQPE